MYHIKSALALRQYPGALPQNILQRTEHLMSGDGSGIRQIFQAVLPPHIRGIRRNDVKRGRFENLRRLFDIPRHYIDFFRNPVVQHAASRHIRAFILDLQPGKMRPFRLRFQQNRNHPGSRAQIQHTLPRLHLHKICQKHRVHTKTKPLRILDDHIPAELQIIQTFPGLQICIRHSFSNSPSSFSSSLDIFCFLRLGLKRRSST